MAQHYRHIEDVKNQILKHLKEYANTYFNIDPTKKSFRCPEPSQHNDGKDTTPSAGFASDEAIYCFGCKRVFDIFDLANIKEGLPLSGPEFVTVTMKGLADRYGIKLDIDDDIPEETKKRLKYSNFYRDLLKQLNSVAGGMDPDVKSYLIDNRKFTEKVLNNSRIYSSPGYEKVSKNLIDTGWDESYISNAGITKLTLREKCAIIPIFDPHGVPIGLASRDINWKKESAFPKYVNTSNNDLYQKSEILYGFEQCRNSEIIYITEGYFDVLRLRDNGIPYACSINGTVLSEAHLGIIEKSKAKELLLVLDGDKAGISAINKSLKLISSKLPQVTTRVISLPDNHDPDSFIREFGIDEFRKLPRQSVVSYRLNQLDKSKPLDSPEMETICEYIASNPNPLRRYAMMKDVENWSEDRISLTAIKERVDQIIFQHSEQLKQEENALGDLIIHRLKKGEPINLVISDADEAYNTIHERASRLKLDPITTFKDSISASKKMFSEYSMGIDLEPLTNFHKNLHGIPRNSAMISLGGLPSDGKSSFLRFLTYNIATRNKDVVVVYLSIDDALPKVIPGMVSLCSEGKIKINEVMFPEYYGLSMDGVLHDDLQAAWNKLYSINNIVILDSSSGNTLGLISRSLNSIQNYYPDKKMVVLLDNLHNVRPDIAYGGTREVIIESSRVVKMLCDQFDIPIITTVQFNKAVYLKELPQINDISDTIRIAYDSDQIWLFKNQVNGSAKPEEVPLKWVDEEGNIKPIVELFVLKNKVPGSAWMGNTEFKFDPEYNQFSEFKPTKPKTLKSIISDDN